MRNRLLLLLLLCSACGDDAGSTNYDAGNGNTMDAPEFAPSLTSFQASPSQVPSGTPTMVTWNWTFAVEPTFPEPSCTIDNGVGAVMKGQQTSVTITSVTTFTITCTNSAGSAMRQVVIGVPPSAPVLSTFTATPTGTLTAGVAGNVTFAWTYSNSPTPTPVCTVDGGVGTVTNGQSVSVTLPQARFFRLRCTNGVGQPTYLDAARVAVNECGTSYATCGNNSTCNETAESYTCGCASGYTGDGNTCGVNAAGCSATPALCDTNADCIGDSYCACKIGYVGNGGPGQCTRLKIAFVTSTTHTGTGLGGLTGADAICDNAATAGGLPAGDYVAWLSDSTNDAYCRVQGYTGKRSNNCGLGALPAAAGPWVRSEAAATPRKAFAPKIDVLTGPNRFLYYPAVNNESGTEIASATDRVWTGTSETGEATTNTCANWTGTGVTGGAGLTHGGSTTWTRFNSVGADPSCSSSYRLRCMETGNSTVGLPPRHPISTIKRAFVTSTLGNGALTMWPDALTGANQTVGITAADEICKTRARYVGYTNWANFKAWMSTSSSLTELVDRIVTLSTPYVRPDGVVLGATRADMLDGKLAGPWNQTELGTFVQGNGEAAGPVWTGSYYYGNYTSGYNCSAWTSSQSFYQAMLGHHDLLDQLAVGNFTGSYYYQNCDQSARIYCVED